MKNISSITATIFFLVLGLLTGISSLMVFLMDPVAAKMADDSDPSGDPYISWESKLAMASVCIASMATANYFRKKI